jgi:hypothetical protein
MNSSLFELYSQCTTSETVIEAQNNYLLEIQEVQKQEKLTRASELLVETDGEENSDEEEEQEEVEEEVDALGNTIRKVTINT